MRGMLTVLGAVAAMLTGPVSAQEAGKTTRIALGTGEVTGYYYPVGGAVCRLINRDRARHGLHCLVAPTPGSGANIGGLRDGTLELGIVQSKGHMQAFEGSGPFKDDGPFPELRSLFTLHTETLVVLARADSKIKTVADLKNKRIAVGPADTFQRSMAQALIDALKWRANDLEGMLEMDPAQQVEALCDGQIDAAIFAAVHPSGTVSRAVDGCEARLVEVEGQAVQQYLASHPYLTPVTVPAGAYSGLEAARKSFGMAATVVTTARLPADTAYEIVKVVFDNISIFNSLYPPLAVLERQAMIGKELAAPLHEGAARYFREAGLLK